jgi:ABC-type uncharacterized transport system involved in gliding motility auxiliary subunit
MAGIKLAGNHFKYFTYLLVVVLINLAGLTLFFRLDLTEDKIYSISPASQKVVSTLSDPLTINVFFTKNLPAPHNNTEQYLHDLLEEYAISITVFLMSARTRVIFDPKPEKTRSWPKATVLTRYKFR